MSKIKKILYGDNGNKKPNLGLATLLTNEEYENLHSESDVDISWMPEALREIEEYCSKGNVRPEFVLVRAEAILNIIERHRGGK